MAFPNLFTVKAILQDVDINMWLENRNAQDDMDIEEIILPENIPNGSVIVVRPSTGSLDLFWIAQVESQSTNKRYQLHYLKKNEKSKVWSLGKGNYWRGTCSKESVLHVGVNFNENGTMTAASRRIIENIVSKDV